MRYHLRYALSFIRFFVWFIVLNRPVVWICTQTGAETREYWTLRSKWALRPMYWGLLKRLRCGCSRRLGRIVLYRLGCEEHCGLSISFKEKHK